MVKAGAISAAGLIELLSQVLKFKTCCSLCHSVKVFQQLIPAQRLSPALLEKLKKLEDMQRQLQGALHGWLSQLLQQREALVACFGLGDVESVIGSVTSDPSAAAAVNDLPRSVELWFRARCTTRQ